MNRLLTLVTLLAGVIACDSATEPDYQASTGEDVSAVSNTADLGATTLPVHGLKQASSGSQQIIGWCNEAAGVVLIAAPGTGTSTHGGRFEIEQTNCVDTASGAITGGTATLTTANGDEIHMWYSGQVLPGVVPQTLNLDYVLIGGTGRFEHAEGELSAAVYYTSATTWISDGAGWIQYAASDGASN